MELIGRARDLAEVDERLAAGRRLVTIIGPGGVGKTSLGATVLERRQAGYPLGGHVVDLSRVDRPDAVAGALAAQLGFSSFEALLQSPTDQPALLLVDNCEHVGDAAAAAIGLLIEHCASPTVLATSRSPLNLPGESVVALAPLAVPERGAESGDESSDAVQLFRERARDAGVTIDGDELLLVGDLCRRLDGLPLAIEIAAARTRSLAVADILGRLDEGIGVLERPRFRGASRHRSLGDTIAWSYRLLDDEARAAFDRLGVCAGPFPLELATAVAFDTPTGAATTLDALDRLIDASLLVAVRTPSGTRYRMLETVRAVALAQLEARGELTAIRDRFADHVFAATVAMMGEARRQWSADLLPRLLERFDAIDAALRHCLDHDADPRRAFLLCTALWGAVHQARVDEVLDLARLVRVRWPDPTLPSAADAATTLAFAQLLCGHSAEAVEVARGALPHVGAAVFAAANLRRVLGLAARAAGDRAAAAALLAEAAEAARAGDVPTVELECRVYRAQDLAALGQRGEALRVVREAAAEATELGSALNEVWARTVEGAILAAHDPAGAQPLVEATLERSAAIDYPFGVTSNLQTLVRCQLARGAPAPAAEAAGQLLEAIGRSGAGDLRAALDLSAAVLRAAGQPGWPDLAATAATLPNTNPMAMGTTAAAVDHPGRVLPLTEATRQARRWVASVASGASGASGRSAALPTPAAAVVDGQHAADAADAAENVFVRVGDRWDVRYAATTVHLKATKGMDDLARLLAEPGREVHCLELAGAGVQEASVGEVIDQRARRAYEARVRELQAEIDEADADHDRGRAERARIELDALVDQLTAALGLGGRARQQGGTAARARSAVTHRLRATMRHIADEHPALGRHLEASVRTGIYCCYRPERPTGWRT